MYVFSLIGFVVFFLGIVFTLLMREYFSRVATFIIIGFGFVGMVVSAYVGISMERYYTQQNRLLERGYLQYDSRTGELQWTDEEMEYLFDPQAEAPELTNDN